MAPKGTSSVLGRGLHAMVLDTIRDGKFIFKNTHSDNKKFEIEVGLDDAPKEFFFVHIILDLSRFDQIRQKLAKKKSRKRKAESSQP